MGFAGLDDEHVGGTKGDGHLLAGLAVVTALSVVSVLMIIDPHITYRGSGDLIFALLGITAAGASMVPNGRSR